ncbi:MAG: enoyl-CoA hydratase/isomerase family protein [Dehalococcoidales bacterium]|nr:enoyl-CoA hydratase/isomerase family protein [Dehalococcoidales bacterium]
MAYQFILYDKESGAAIITINRPQVLNAWHGRTKMEMISAIEDAESDPSVLGIIFTGAGRAFSAGGSKEYWGLGTERSDDKEEAPSHWLPGDEERQRWMQEVDSNRLVDVVLGCRKPTIAAINGVIVGGPLGLVCACDIRIASDRAQLRSAFGRRGHTLNVGVSYWLPRIIGMGHTLELAYTNDIWDAREMERVGFVNRIVPHEELIPYCKDMIKRMSMTSPVLLNAIKKSVRKAYEARDIVEGRQWEGWGMRAAQSSQDAREAEQSLLEKRDPVYKGQ